MIIENIKEDIDYEFDEESFIDNETLDKLDEEMIDDELEKGIDIIIVEESPIVCEILNESNQEKEEIINDENKEYIDDFVASPSDIEVLDEIGEIVFEEPEEDSIIKNMNILDSKDTIINEIVNEASISELGDDFELSTDFKDKTINEIVNEASISELSDDLELSTTMMFSTPPFVGAGDTNIYWAYYNLTKKLLIGNSSTVFPTSGLTVSGNYPCGIVNYVGLTKSDVTEIEFYDFVEPINMSQMFQAFNNVSKINFNGNLNTQYTTTFNNCFSYCYSLKEIDLSDFDFSSIVDASSLDAMFAVCNNLHTIYVTNTSDLIHSIYAGMNIFTSTNLIGGQGSSYSRYISDMDTVLKIDKHNDVLANAGLFTEKGTDVYWIYDNSNNEMVFGPSKDDVWFSGINGIYYSYQVNDSKKLGSIITSNYTYGSTASLSWQDSTYFDKTNVKSVRFLPNTRPINMCEWFEEFSNLKTIDFSNIDSTLLTNLYALCKNCTSLESVTFGTLDTSNVEVMESMFEGCSSLETIDITSFNTSSLNDASSSSGSTGAIEKMFYGCSNLKTIYAKNRTVIENDFTNCNNSLNSNMFVNCYELIGSKGTKYSIAGIDDNTYALVDDGITGYFSLYPSPIPPTPYIPHGNSGKGNGGTGGNNSTIPIYDSNEIVENPSNIINNINTWTTDMGIYQWRDGTCKLIKVLYNFYLDKFYFADNDIIELAEKNKYLEANEKLQINIISENIIKNQWVGISFAPDIITWYYVDINGKKITGWQQINGFIYYFNEDGKMLTGVHYINNVAYYFDIRKGVEEGKLIINYPIDYSN